MLELQEAQEWLRAFYDEDEELIQGLLDSTPVLIFSATGVPINFQSIIAESEIYEDFCSMYKMVQKFLLSDLFNERDSINVALTSMYTQLELTYKGIVAKL